MGRILRMTFYVLIGVGFFASYVFTAASGGTWADASGAAIG